MVSWMRLTILRASWWQHRVQSPWPRGATGQCCYSMAELFPRVRSWGRPVRRYGSGHTRRCWRRRQHASFFWVGPIRSQLRRW